MLENVYTVNQIAEKLNVSKATVYNRLKTLKKDLKPFTKTSKGITYIDSKGFELIENSIYVSNVSNISNEIQNNTNNNLNQNAKTHDDVNTTPDINTLLLSELEHFKKQFELFQNQLETKDKQIEELNKALNQSQKINENNQILLRESHQKVLMLENPQPKERQSFWKKIFKN